MARRTTNDTAPYQSIRNASRLTGLSTYFIREGCKNGSIPCIRIGREYKILLNALLEKLETQALKGE